MPLTACLTTDGKRPLPLVRGAVLAPVVAVVVAGAFITTPVMRIARRVVGELRSAVWTCRLLVRGTGVHDVGCDSGRAAAGSEELYRGFYSGSPAHAL
jgi:hypothetical protein